MTTLNGRSGSTRTAPRVGVVHPIGLVVEVEGTRINRKYRRTHFNAYKGSTPSSLSARTKPKHWIVRMRESKAAAAIEAQKLLNGDQVEGLVKYRKTKTSDEKAFDRQFAYARQLGLDDIPEEWEKFTPAQRRRIVKADNRAFAVRASRERALLEEVSRTETSEPTPDVPEAA